MSGDCIRSVERCTRKDNTGHQCVGGGKRVCTWDRGKGRQLGHRWRSLRSRELWLMRSQAGRLGGTLPIIGEGNA